MKTLVTLLLACCFGSAMAQSNLPACPSSVDVLWNNCYGSFVYPAGAKYVGEYKLDKPYGQRTTTFANGYKYVGEFKSDKRNGQGTYHYPDGRRHLGEWVNGIPNGRFIEFRADGSVEKSGIYANGKLVRPQVVEPGIFTSARPPGIPQLANWRCVGWRFATPVDVCEADRDGACATEIRSTLARFSSGGDSDRYCANTLREAEDARKSIEPFLASCGAKYANYPEEKLCRLLNETPQCKPKILFALEQIGSQELCKGGLATVEIVDNGSNQGAKEKLSDCTGSVMVFSDGRESCTSSYSTVIRGDVGLSDALTSKLYGEFYAFASNMILGGGGGFGGTGARFHGSGGSQKSLAQASRIAVNECESVRSRLVPFVSGTTTFKRTDECVLLISAEPAGPLNVTLSEAEFHKTWPSDQLIYTRNVKMYGEAYAKSQLSEPPPQVQAEAKPELSDLEKALAEAEEAKRKQAELQAQLVAAQQQTPAKPPPKIAPQGKRVALVIGNAKYKFNPLSNPVNDATDMAASLRSVGFDVIEVKDATLKQMRAATRQFADKLEVSDVGLVYYSGHGIEVKGKNYLIPVNADIRREYEVVDQAFDASNLLRMMEGLQSGTKKRVNILIVDACRNNDLPKSWRSTNNGLARMDAPAGSFISFATAPGQVASDGQGRNSPYTKHLLQALKQPGMPIEQVFKQVRRKVMAETAGEQVPWENSSLVGDFYFTVAK